VVVVVVAVEAAVEAIVMVAAEARAAGARASGEERLVPTSSRILFHLSRLMVAMPFRPDQTAEAAALGDNLEESQPRLAGHQDAFQGSNAWGGQMTYHGQGQELRAPRKP
jgi:hypothetical protein